MLDLRLMFSKTGAAAFISHLDLMRMFQRAFLRAGLPIKYSEGFNPHAILSIALPLSVGTSSVCELLDFRLAEDFDIPEIPGKLSGVLPEGLAILGAYEPVSKFRDIAYLEISGALNYGQSGASAVKELDALFSTPEIVVPKKGKKGTTDMDIAPLIKSISFSPNEDGIELSAVISAQNPTLNPEYIAEAIKLHRPELSPDYQQFTRKKVLKRDLSEFT